MARNIVQRLPVAGKAVLACSRSFVTVRPLFKPTDAAIRQLSSIRPVHQTIRTFAASAISKQSTALVEAINDELEHEKTQNTDREVRFHFCSVCMQGGSPAAYLPPECLSNNPASVPITRPSLLPQSHYCNRAYTVAAWRLGLQRSCPASGTTFPLAFHCHWTGHERSSPCRKSQTLQVTGSWLTSLGSASCP